AHLPMEVASLLKTRLHELLQRLELRRQLLSALWRHLVKGAHTASFSQPGKLLWWLRFVLDGAVLLVRIRSSNTDVGSSLGSCGTSSPRKALASSAEVRRST